MGPLWLAGLFTAWGGAIAWFDVRQRRIPNALLILLAVPAVLAVVVYRRGLLGADALDSLSGLLVGAAPLLAGYFIRQVGAGDVKLSALQGFILGVNGACKALLIGGVVLGLMSALAYVRLKLRGPGRKPPAGVALVAGFVVTILVDHLWSGRGT
jgi:Flp pilus assembly protein protease CpaA